MKCENKMLLRSRCDEDVYKDGKCIFHLENKNPQECDIFKQKLPIYLNIDSDKDFNGFIFPNNEDFSDIHFDKHVYFDNAKFLIDAYFRNTIFGGNVSFRNTEFKGDANFSYAKFKGDANFNYSKFGNDVSFKLSIFDKNVYFDRAKFEKEARILNTGSENDVDFLEAIFKNKTSFVHTEFITVNVDFSFAKFYGIASFDRVKFNKEARFSNVEFLDDLHFVQHPSFGDNIIWFNKVVFNRQKITRFRNISNVYFLETDISGVEFIDVTWEKNIRKITNVIQTGNATYEQVSGLYRMLRMNYEKRYRFTDAGDFFIIEMDIRRLNVDTKHEKLKNVILWQKRNISIISIYKFLSDYGENYWRPIFFGIILIFSYPIMIYLLCGFPDNIYNSYFSFHDLEKSDLRDSIKSFFQIGDRYLIERLMSIPILGSIFIALKRRFERNR